MAGRTRFSKTNNVRVVRNNAVNSVPVRGNEVNIVFDATCTTPETNPSVRNHGHLPPVDLSEKERCLNDKVDCNENNDEAIDN